MILQFQMEAQLNFDGYLFFGAAGTGVVYACRVEYLPFLKDYPAHADFLSSPLNAPPALTYVIKGAVLVFAVLLDVYLKRNDS